MMDAASLCFHCDLPLKAKIFYLKIKHAERAFCCIGCQMVAEAIVHNGLENYYDFRDNPSLSQLNIVPPELLELDQYDLVDIQKKYLDADQALPSGTKKIILSIDGITCAACVWLLEKRITRLSGVVKFTVNLTNHRAELCWNEADVTVSAVLLAIAKIGFRAQPFEINKEESARKREYSKALKRLAISGFGFGQVMMFAAPLYSWFSHGIPVSYRDFFRIVSLVVTTPVLVYCGMPFFKSAWISVKSRLLSMDVSISLALLVVYIAGIYATVMRTGEVYFDSITMFLFFITLSRYLEMRARHHSSFIVQQLSHQQPSWVTRITNDLVETVAVSRVLAGDTLIIKTGATIPVDGVVLEGESSVGESLLTGEPLPKLKVAGDVVVAGSVNNGNPLKIRVTRIGDDTTLATILKLYERAQFDKPRIVSLTQKFSHYFVLIQMVAALILFLVWVPYSVSYAFWTTISLLVISCPCALAIATPIALTAAMNALSKTGFLCTRGHVIESIYKATDIIFDKTGTLTEGKFSIHSMQLFADVSRQAALQIAASLEAQSEHPIASAFKINDDLLTCERVIVHANLGVEGDVNGQHYYLGNHKFICQHIQHEIDDHANDQHFTKVILAANGAVLAIFNLEDKLRDNARATIAALRESGYHIHLLSGDNTNAVKYCADMLNIPVHRAACSPADKLQYVKALQKSGAEVVMLGDGINDAPVLMQAQISIAMSEAADLTRVSADAVLMNNDLSLLIKVFRHAKKAHLIIRQCLVWAIVYNIICLPLAVSGMVAPYVAAALMSLSSILVVANALRLMRIRTNTLNFATDPQLLTATA